MLTFSAAYDSIHLVAEITQQNKINAIVAQLVEYNLAKVGVAGSSPVYRSLALEKSRAFLFLRKHRAPCCGRDAISKKNHQKYLLNL